MPAFKVPVYGLHKPTGQARCYLNGKSVYLGQYDSPESRKRYAEVISQFVSGQAVETPAKKRSKPVEADPGLTVNELVAAYLSWADGHYLKNGQPTSEIHCLKSAVKPLVDIYGFNAVDTFGPVALKAVREQMVASGWCRAVVNRQVSRIRSCFKWGVENEMVQVATLEKLQAVAPLLSGRTPAHDNPGKKPATDEQIAAIRGLVSPLVWDLVQLQRLTGARAGELLQLTPEKLDRSGDVWLYNVEGHKTAHHGHSRIVTIGRRGQEILSPRLSELSENDLVFPIRRDSYTLAIRRACEKYNRENPGSVIEVWSPHQLRHAKAHEIRERFGLEAVQAVLGHAGFQMSERYAQATLGRAVEAAAETG